MGATASRFAPVAGRTSPAIQVLGLHELDTTLSMLSADIASGAMRSGLGAMNTRIKQVVRANVKAHSTGYPEDAAIRRAARMSIGSRINKHRTKGWLSRIGFGVGFRGDARDRRLTKGKYAHKKKSVGISRRTIHWWVLGAGGDRPGDIRPTFAGILKESVAASRTTALNVLRAKIWERVKILTARRRGKALKRAGVALLRRMF